MLNPKQKDKCIRILDEYLQDMEMQQADANLDASRQVEIKVILPLIEDYLSNQISIADFKKTIDSRSKLNLLWGFKGIKGMMFFNLLYSASKKHNTEIDSILKTAIKEPENTKAALDNMIVFYNEVQKISQLFKDKRKGPNIWAVPYFLTYFWQIQNPEKWAIQYTSTEKTFEMLGLWTLTADIVESYNSFLTLFDELRNLYSKHTGKPFSFWQVEHVFYWFYTNQQEPEKELIEPPQVEKESITVIEKVMTETDSISLKELPGSYIPPIISILPRLARMDEDMERLCREQGQGISKVFEDRIAIALRMLGFDVRQWGQGHGRGPDGVALSKGNRYAIIYDAKASKYPYEIKQGSRQFVDYIRSEKPILREEEGIDMIFFAVMSGIFPKNQDKEIKRIKLESGVNEVILIPAESLLVLVQKRLQDYSSILGRRGLLDLLIDGGILSKDLIEETFGR